MLNYLSQRQIIFGQVSSPKMHTDFTWHTCLSAVVSLGRRLIHTCDFYPPSSRSAPLSSANRTLLDQPRHCHGTYGKPSPVVWMSTKHQIEKKQNKTTKPKKESPKPFTDRQYNFPEHTLLGWESEYSNIKLLYWSQYAAALFPSLCK